MSIFDLPYEEYIRAREKIMEEEAAAEIVQRKLANSNRHCLLSDKLLRHKQYPDWWRNIWKQQYESQGGVVCMK